MRRLLLVPLFLLLVLGVILPALYFNAGRQLPPLETEFHLETLLRHAVEGERMTQRFGQFGGDRSEIEWKKPDFTHYPKDLVALYLVQLGCPGFLQSPREEGWDWAKRVLAGVFRMPQPGDGRCEHYLALRLALAIGVEDDLGLAVAIHRLHDFMEKDQLLAYDLASSRFERGLIGVENAAEKLFQKPLEALTLAQLAELALTLPGGDDIWFAMKTCKNASLLQQNRDALLSAMVQYSLVSPERAQNAQAQPVSCQRRR